MGFNILLILTCTIALRYGTVRTTCFSWDTGVPASEHSEQIQYSLDQQELYQRYSASRTALSNQIFLVNGTAQMTLNLCYILSAGFSLHNFHPKTVLDNLVGPHCFSHIILQQTELVFTVDENNKFQIQTFKKFKASILQSYGLIITLTKQDQDTILVWVNGFKIENLNSQSIVTALATASVMEASHQLNQILKQEDIVLSQLESLKEFMQSANPRPKRSFLDLFLGPSLGKLHIVYIFL